MSFNLYAEGELDYVALARDTEHQSLELFPITGDDGPDALGIALPSKFATATARDELRTLVERLQLIGVRVYDLYSGLAIETEDDLADLFARIFDS